jgi:hypothetical protein
MCVVATELALYILFYICTTINTHTTHTAHTLHTHIVYYIPLTGCSQKRCVLEMVIMVTGIGHFNAMAETS